MIQALGIAFAVVFTLTFARAFFSVNRASGLTKDSGKTVLKALPGIDCDECGYGTCFSFAAAVMAGQVELEACYPGVASSSDSFQMAAADRAKPKSRLVAVVTCGSFPEKSALAFHYDGFASCRAAFSRFDGFKRCKQACLGLGDCVKACPRDAIAIVDGLATTDPRRCDGCGLCIEACPGSVLRLHPRSVPFHVACSSHDEPVERTLICSVCCDACRACEKASPNGEFRLEGRVAVSNPVTSRQWVELAGACPRGAILPIDRTLLEWTSGGTIQPRRVERER